VANCFFRSPPFETYLLSFCRMSPERIILTNLFLCNLKLLTAIESKSTSEMCKLCCGRIFVEPRQRGRKKRREMRRGLCDETTFSFSAKAINQIQRLLRLLFSPSKCFMCSLWPKVLQEIRQLMCNPFCGNSLVVVCWRKRTWLMN